MAATAYGLMIGMMLTIFMASFVSADPELLQDVCVADLNSGVKLNGFACKSYNNISANDFFFAGLAKPGLTNNTFGEIFTFPRGLIHFQINNGKVPAAVIAGFNSQLPGTQRVADALFASSPMVDDVVLTKAFQVGTEVVEKIKSKFAPKK
ncbi:hypothetical protein L1987_77971 [Smallanthus sonchifolius]|uniref:Uncharacterized protein n=1 Tax=Smallanthus sonchifolius TaxID=185202 RepID=A0ACB8ZBE2_9ASTR|nr:hypothetical protein L1987_77971 [Smallanthus sonchifolius]